VTSHSDVIPTTGRDLSSSHSDVIPSEARDLVFCLPEVLLGFVVFVASNVARDFVLNLDDS